MPTLLKDYRRGCSENGSILFLIQGLIALCIHLFDFVALPLTFSAQISPSTGRKVEMNA